MYDTVIDKLVEVLISGLFSLFSSAYSDFTRIRNIESSLQSLAETRTRIDALLLDAHRARRSLPSSFLLWLHNLHSISLDAQDLIEEHAALTSSNSRKRKRTPSFLLNKGFSDRIQKLKERYDLIYDDRKKLKLDSGESSSRLRDVSYQESAVLDHAHHVFGRNTERSDIVELLVNDTNCIDLPVYSIFGCAGIGKTSLARAVFEDGKVRGFFDLRVWVGLDGKVGVVETMRKIVEAVEKVECRLSSFDLMLWRVRERVMKKKVLFVMDNVWNEELDYWDKLRVALVGSGVGGSKVLVTTGSKSISRNMRVVKSWHLEGLPRDHCWSIFCERAFARGERSRVLEENPELETIGLEIVDKCDGLPLLVKSIASLLYLEIDDREWRCVLEDMLENEEAARSMRVSYDHLPWHLQHCFAFCSIFPAGYEFDKDELVTLWMALGFIIPSGGRTAEDIGAKYFTDLLWRSFFHASDSCYNKDKPMYKMPTVIHELAKSVFAGSECRYIMLSQHNLEPMSFQKVFEMKCLRALILHGERGFISMDVCQLFKKLRYLRVLDLGNSQLEDLPDSIGELLLLRYINLSSTDITTLPETVGNLLNLEAMELGECHQLFELPDSIGNLKKLRYLGLYNTEIESLPESVSYLLDLQKLELGKCYNLHELPEGISNLVNLRYLGLHLDWNDQDRVASLNSMPSGLCKLTKLQTLSRFVVGSQCGIGALKKLNLRGELCISNLENVLNPLDAKEANIRGKRYIDTLMLRWSAGAGSSSTSDSMERVIDYLSPNGNLKNLWIENYNGCIFPVWMQDLLELETLRLSDCKKCENLPYVGKLQHLRTLQIEGLDCIESLDPMFFDGCDARHEVNGNGIGHFSKLTITRCSGLINLRYLPLALRRLEITDCPQLNWDNLPVLPTLQDLVVVGGSEATINWIEHLIDLSSLTISQFSLVDFIPKGLALLRKLKIQECYKLQSLAFNGNIQCLSLLEYLEISFCPNFSIFPEEGLPASLTEIRLISCENLSSWPCALNNLQALHLIEIQDVPQLKSVTALPTDLHCLKIKGCPALQRWCHEHADDLRNIPCFDVEPVPPSWFMKIVKQLTQRTSS